MTTQTGTKEELLTSIGDVVAQLLGLMSALDEQAVNRVPYKDSWTAGQLFRHVAKSTSGVAVAMTLGTKPAERDPGERIPALKKNIPRFWDQHEIPGRNSTRSGTL